MAGEEVLRKFGRYFLLDRIAQGGMAEIYRARMAASDGAGRLIVIKRIQGAYGENKEFVDMFKSEIKVTMGFNHPNIVQLYDFGQEQGQPYIAMELVDGKNLRQYMGQYGRAKQRFPIELAAYIIEQAAAGLHYAHSFKDKITGEPLHIVHRDISPQNILISYDGGVKVIDFGIAKAKTNTEATRAGVIKGKPSYLSPEQIEGKELDGRSDVFSLGIVLWELLTGRKLFAAPGESEFAVLKLIENCTTHVRPPSETNPDVPKELDAIVLKCLVKDRDKRYQSAEELQRALHRFIYSVVSDFNPSDLSYAAKSLFKDEIVADRKKLQSLNGRVEQLLANDIPDAPQVDPVRDSDGRPMRKEDTTQVARNIKPSHTVLEVDAKTKSTQVELETRFTANPTSRPKVPGSSAQPVPQRVRPISGGGSGPSAGTGSRASSNRKSGGLARFVIAAGVAAAVGVWFFGDEGKKLLQKNEQQSQAAAPGGSGAKTASGAEGAGAPDVRSIALRLRLSPGPGQTRITLNGQAVDPSEPVIRVPMDQSLELHVDREGFKSFRRDFVLESRQYNGLAEASMDVALEPERFGYLTLHTTPSADAEVHAVDSSGRVIASHDGVWRLKTPLENEKFPVGNYRIRLVNAILGMEKELTVEVRDGKSVTLDERLEVK